MKTQADGNADRHAYNCTLAAALGFADEDKRNPLHGLACHYLIQTKIAVSVGEAVLEGRDGACRCRP
jgi:hypothetical protein